MATKTLAGRILACDDSATIRHFIETLLQPLHSCLCVTSAEEALSVVDTFHPDLIITDIVMDGMNGYELCQKLRERPELATIPLVLLTSQVGEEERMKGLELGADDFLCKPIRSRELLARVHSLLRLRHATVSLEERTRQLERSNRELQEAQTALTRTEKLATIGTLASGVAHEINNPLAYMKAGVGAILGLVDELEASMGPAPPHHTIAEMRQIGAEVSDGVQRIERIVRDLGDFASERKENLEEVNLAEEIDRAWKLARLKAHHVEFQAQLEGTLWLSTVRHRFGQVLVNIFINAVQAIGNSSGAITVTARPVGNNALIAITDSGPGIPPEILSRIFDPFFTTKRPGTGTGLGLSVSYGILQSLGGKIEAISPPGQGATFTLEVPLARRTLEPSRALET
ncbi:MAG: hybrid sensor histidine kinase/response regulator [Myxococcota bacterium]